MRINDYTEEERITMALEHATEAIKTLRRKLDIAGNALIAIATAGDGCEDHIAKEALERIENEQ